jgi:DHA1 family bicyclomycin/chloramphenicol resistance-like MFS transporter
MNKKLFASMIMTISTLSGVLVMTLGTLTPMLFWLSFLLMSLSGTVIRPFSTNLLLDQQESDTGSASSVIGTLFTILGSVGMSLASIPWGNIVFGLGIIITVFSLLSLLSWNMFMKSKIPCLGVKNASSN